MTSPSGPAGKNVLVPSAFQTRTFANTAVGLLREMILSGAFGPGERLNELAISEQLQISRSPIREALQALAGQGLVRFVAGRGAYVMDFDADSVRHIGEVRVALETRAARLASDRATPEQIGTIEKILQSANQAIETGAIARMLQNTDHAIQTGAVYPPELDFHHAVVEASHNPRLIAVTGEITTQFRLARARGGREDAWAASAYAEHVAIFDSIRRGDPDGASEAMEVHVANSTSSLIAHIEASGGHQGG